MNLVPTQFAISKVTKKDLAIANYTSENVLLKANPRVKMWQDLTDGVLEYVATQSPNIYGMHTSLIKSFSNANAIRYVNSEWVQWSLKGNGKAKVISMENMMPGVKTPGIEHSEITIKVNKNFWKSSDTVYPELAPTMEFTVQGDGVSDGTGFIYTLIYHTTEAMEYVDPSLLEQGLIWIKRGSTVSEGSREYGSSYVGGTSFITFRSNLTSWSKSHETTDKGWATLLKLTAVDANGNKIPGFKDMIITFGEAEFEAQSKYEHEQVLFWSQAAGKNIIDPSTGYYRRIAPGMIQWYMDGNMTPYSTANFSVDHIKNIIRSFMYGRVMPKNSNIVVECGLGLLELVNDALTEKFSVRPIERSQDLYIKPGSSFPGSKQKGFTLTNPQFLGFDMFPYGSVEFKHLPILDNEELLGGLRHPVTGYPLTSYWGFIKNIGIGTTNNVELLKKKNSYFRTYQCGVWSPAGPIMGQNKRGFVATSGQRGYKLLAGDTFGTRVKDVKRTLFLHPAIEM